MINLILKNKYKIIIPEQTSELINKFHDLGLQNNDTHNFYGNDINCNLKFGVDFKDDNFFNQFKNTDSIKEFCNSVTQKIIELWIIYAI